ncbi:hypothetical protein RMATCC62417_17060 [Rhizopus microsporus]|nr:hypothetical protein RMATCC62417_17060 [Rhizopus microsporus]
MGILLISFFDIRIDEIITNEEEQRVVEGALNDPITHLAAMVDRLNDEQRRVFNCLTIDMTTAGNLYFVFGAAGTGKSFLLKALSAFFEQQGVKSVMLAPTGIASYTARG